MNGRIVLLDEEFPSNVLPWRRVAAETGATIVTVQYNDTYLPGARRFEVGEKCTSTILPGAIAALEQLQRRSLPVVARGLAAINARLQDRLEALGFELPPPAQRCPHLFGAQMPAHVSGSLVGSLREQNVFVSQRGSSIRFAPHLTEGDIEQLFTALASSASR